MSTDLLIPLPFRKMDVSGTDWKAVKKFLAQHYKDDQVKSTTATLDRLNDLRKHIAQSCVKGTKQPPTEAFIEGYLREYAALVALAQKHLPLCTGEIKNLQFTWIDCLDGKSKNSVNSNAELIGVVMNMAASLTNIACTEVGYKSVEGVKNAFKLFQAAAGLYQWIPGTLSLRLTTNEVIGDFAPNCFSTFTTYTLAQAHHSAYLKAGIEMSDKYAILSKLAMEAGKQYGCVESGFRSLGLLEPTLQTYCATAIHVFTAKAHCHLGQGELAKEEIGVAIGRFQEAMGCLGHAEVAAKADATVSNWVHSVQAHISQLLAGAQNKNDTVYFARVSKNLPPPEALGRPMGKATPAESVLVRPTDEPNPFKGIIPVHVSSVVSDYKSKMNKALLQASSQVLDHRDRCNRNVEHLGVHQAINTAERGDGKKATLPDTLRRKITSIRTDKNGSTFKVMDTLINMLGHVTNSASAAESTVTQISQELFKEDAQDKQYLATYGEKVWYSMRQPSSKLPDVLSLNKIVIELQSAIQTQIQQPKQRVVEQMQGEVLQTMNRLDWPFDQLDSLMPYTETRAAKQLSDTVLLGVEKLKTYLNRLQEVDAEESDTLKQLTDLVSTDHVTELISAVAPEKHSEILDALTVEFNGAITRLKATMEEADHLVESSQEAMLNMAEVQSDDPVADETQKFCSALDHACSLYQRIHQQLGDLSTTASNVTDKAESALSSAQSFVLGRSVEAEDFSESLDQQVKVKMQEVELKRQQSDDLRQTQSRQQELQRQIAELEAQRTLQPSGAIAGAQVPTSGGVQQQQQQQQHVLDALAQDQNHSNMNSVFGTPSGAPAYSYQPTTPPPGQAYTAPAPNPYQPPTSYYAPPYQPSPQPQAYTQPPQQPVGPGAEGWQHPQPPQASGGGAGANWQQTGSQQPVPTHQVFSGYPQAGATQPPPPPQPYQAPFGAPQ